MDVGKRVYNEGKGKRRGSKGQQWKTKDHTEGNRTTLRVTV